ncbi:Aspartate aminotransferase [Pelagimonas phthalicica]|uniref:aspartate transaminase n=1 Tax=Pelagimonas phthalicica TaxID=1037362 RepID=A0A238JEF0_9RHOB|nr:aminotransferase [Pelagimonas phthalicica]TDS91304.1 aspartate/methionine/tyrosine aminotransferase [Pelagimonas phthalicica]SMX28352.1 Aspartate aminotransferase [Pelagimonas phthalicica]
MSSWTQTTFAPPIPAARKWLDGVTFSPDRPLINLSQAVPADPPPLALQEVMAEALKDPETHLYGPVLGLPSLRETLAQSWSGFYAAPVRPDQIAITAGCNQAFTATIAALCGAGDEVILPVPWYFNHKMCLDMSGVIAKPMSLGADLLPDPDIAKSLISPRTKAILLISPNNPTGVEYPPALLHSFFELARDHGLKLIIDETYRDFHSGTDPVHDLLKQADWDQTLIQLYSFSKSFRMTGHRTGAIFANAKFLAEVEKYLDTTTICAPTLGQTSAEWGLRNLTDWLADQRQDLIDRRAAIETHFPKLAAKGWRLQGVGAYFAWVTHPFAESADRLAPKLVTEAGVLLLPASMFMPEGDPNAPRAFRVAFANVNAVGIAEFTERLASLDWPLAGA